MPQLIPPRRFGQHINNQLPQCDISNKLRYLLVIYPQFGQQTPWVYTVLHLPLYPHHAACHGLPVLSGQVREAAQLAEVTDGRDVIIFIGVKAVLGQLEVVRMRRCLLLAFGSDRRVFLSCRRCVVWRSEAWFDSRSIITRVAISTSS